MFRNGEAAGRIVGTRDADARSAHSAGAIEHDRIPFVSYPYEWTFGMLRDAALLHLDLMREALAEDMILKDASPYNVQWRGARPVFIDIPSFEPLAKGAPWVGYRQFCELFLYPLMLQAYKGADFRPWLRGRIDGIPAGRDAPADVPARSGEARRAASRRCAKRAAAPLFGQQAQRARNPRGSRLRQGADPQQRGQARRPDQPARARRASGPSGRTTTGRIRTTRPRPNGRPPSSAKSPRPGGGGWRGTSAATRASYARILAEHSDCVVAMDGDPEAIEALYRNEKAVADGRILPLVVNLADASPNQGWLGRERKGLAERGRPELTLCLALIHHIVITANIPLEEFIGWLADMETSVVIEFVWREDEMVQVLLQNREDQYDDYREDRFRTLLAARFDILGEQELKGGKRRAFFARPKQR